MLLAVDVGNSHTVFALCQGHEIRAQVRIPTDTRTTADVLWATLSGILALKGFSLGDVARVVVCSVVPAYDRVLAEMVDAFCPHSAHFLTAQDVGLPINLPHPETVGMDRLVNAAAAMAVYGAPVIVIDFGTATTFDVVTAAGCYAGGLIAPGPEVSLRALAQAAAKLPMIALAPPPKVLGKTTQDAMQSGLYYGYLSMIEGLLFRLKAEVFPDVDPAVIATGGIAPLFAPALSIPSVADLTIQGILKTVGASV
jgi:type III pantothenate kinase